jgi:hypothetical protein
MEATSTSLLHGQNEAALLLHAESDDDRNEQRVVVRITFLQTNKPGRIECVLGRIFA